MQGNIKKICWIDFFGGMWFPGPVFAIFLLANGMSLTQVGLIFAGSSIIPFFLDIPSSIWADKYSRKSMLALAWIAYLAMNAMYLFSYSFIMFFVAFCLNGVGTALQNGISHALTYETLLSLGKQDQYEKTQAKIKKYFYTGRLLASLAGAYIYTINPRGVFLFGVMASVASLILVFLLKEPHRVKSISKSFSQIKEGLGFLLHYKIIWYAVIIFSLMAGTHELLYNYYQPVMQLAKIPVVYFGIIYFISSALSILGLVFYLKVCEYLDWRKTIFIYLIIVLITALSFATNLPLLIIVAIILSSFSHSSQDVFISNAINRIVPSSHRATALSIQSQIHLVFNAILIVAISGIADKFSIGFGMLIVSVLIVIISVVFLGLTHKGSALAKTEA